MAQALSPTDTGCFAAESLYSDLVLLALLVTNYGGSNRGLTNMLPEFWHRWLVLRTDCRVPFVVCDLAEIVDAMQAMSNVRDNKISSSVY